MEKSKMNADKKESTGVSFETVLEAELAEIENRRKGNNPDYKADNEKDTYNKAHKMKPIGLAFSGGGIRSATFNLGILQGLAKLGLLPHFDYLSTVSGGGYIGCWLTAWISREKGAIKAVQEKLISRERIGSKNEEHRPLMFLRRYSNYLTPSVGMFSGDTWAFISTYLRNLLLNWLVHLPLFLAVLLMPMIIVAFFVQALKIPEMGRYLLSTSVVLMGFGAFFIGRNQGTSPFPRDRVPWYARPGHIISYVVVPISASALLASLGLWTSQRSHPYDWLIFMYISAPVYMMLFCLGYLSSENRSSSNTQTPQPQSWWRQHQAMLISAPLTMALWEALVILSGKILCVFDVGSDTFQVVTLGMPSMVLVYMAVVTLQIGLLGRAFPDEAREWWSRLGASLFIVLFCWLGLFGTALLGMPALQWIKHVGIAMIGSGWIASTVSGVLAGKSPKTGGQGSDWRIEIVAKVAPYIFIAGLLIFCSFVLSHIVILFTTKWTNPWNDLLNSDFSFWKLVDLNAYLLSNIPLIDFCEVLTALVVLGIFVSIRIDINQFSMNLLYRNRLMRCYLGASNPSRNPTLFTGFDPKDDLNLDALKSPSYIGPYPIINTALNLSGGSELAWQKRKAASFVFAPLYSGYELAIAEKQASDQGVALVSKPLDGYCATAEYSNDEGVKVAEAVSISGAAASPNMGYHTSKPIAFLMDIFNVRLGWWYGNPRYSGIWRSGKSPWGLKYLLAELFGMTDSKSEYVYLSDGGHFENLGIYELVRRRCSIIVACDGGCDPENTFEDLGNAIGKIRVDFGISIEIDISGMKKVPGGKRCAVGRIVYTDVDGEDSTDGILIYIKPFVHGQTPPPPDVLNYAADHESFPHESTGDQWFNETQFESYRMLGEHTVREIAGDVRLSGSISEFRQRAKEYSFKRQQSSNPVVAQHEDQ